jgi:hypothetical protein
VLLSLFRSFWTRPRDGFPEQAMLDARRARLSATIIPGRMQRPSAPLIANARNHLSRTTEEWG